MPPSPFPRLGKFPGDTNPLGKSQEGARRLLETQKSFHISGFETPSIKMRKVCELTPKQLRFGEGNGPILHPLFCSWGGHSAPTKGTVLGTSSCPHPGDTRSGPTPQTTRGWGILGGHQAEGTTEPPESGIPGDTSLPARCHEAAGPGSSCGSGGWVPARDKPPASLDPSSRQRAGLRCTRICHLIAGDQRLFVILGMAGDV